VNKKKKEGDLPRFKPKPENLFSGSPFACRVTKKLASLEKGRPYLFTKGKVLHLQHQKKDMMKRGGATYGFRSLP